ncbi:NADH:flavin oxidoreductase [Candidatus Poriferisocius sp.]|uniref:NADH:flavin oxidoreductase n=1 Tax=Candidatus Poriferisocius sp. TaxID=3101276 RepID=UPI003B02447C
MHAFTPGRIGRLEIKNRFVRAATSETMATDRGEVTPELIELHQTLAANSVGLSLLGHAFVHIRGQSLPNQTGIHDDDMIPGLAQLTGAVHSAGGKIFAQLAHAGNQGGMSDFAMVAPSAMANALTGSVAEPASDEEIEEVIEAFGAAAARAREAGFDGIHIHAANGYLISSFGSPHSNIRTDRWGGDAERRSRLLTRVYQSIRDVVGPEFPVTAKVGMEDQVDNGLELSESVERVRDLAGLGLDGIEVSVGLMASGADSCHKYVAVDRRRALADHLYFRMFSPPSGEAYFEPYAQAIRAVVPDLTLLLVGGMRTTETVERVLAEGSCDFVCLARPLIREPDVVAQIEAGRRGRFDCTSCNLCLENEGATRLQCWRTPRVRLIHAAAAHIRRRVQSKSH